MLLLVAVDIGWLPDVIGGDKVAFAAPAGDPPGLCKEVGVGAVIAPGEAC